VGTRSENGERESKTSFGLKFVMHQLIGIAGIKLTDANVTTLAFVVLHMFGKDYSRAYYYWILDGRPYFPIQIALGLLLGWAFGRRLWHRSMIWVWILPFAYLCYAFVAVPTITSNLPPEFQAGIGESRFAHYFGWGCGPWNNCIDQVDFTLPFYIGAAYSLGGLLARKVSKRIRLNSKLEGGVFFIVGIWFFVAAVSDLYHSIPVLGWHWIFLPYESVCAGIGTYLAFLAVTMWREPRSTGNDSSTAFAG
jgi:hypothetical protein